MVNNSIGNYFLSKYKCTSRDKSLCSNPTTCHFTDLLKQTYLIRDRLLLLIKKLHIYLYLVATNHEPKSAKQVSHKRVLVLAAK